MITTEQHLRSVAVDCEKPQSVAHAEEGSSPLLPILPLTFVPLPSLPPPQFISMHGVLRESGEEILEIEAESGDESGQVKLFEGFCGQICIQRPMLDLKGNHST